VHRPVILVADPVAATGDLLRELFRDELGAFVAVVADADALLAQLDELVPELVVLELAGRGGAEVVRRLRRHPAGRELPLLALADRGGVGCATALRAGCQDCVRKPFRPGQLVDRVGLLIGVTPISRLIGAAGRGPPGPP
jgi:two-component system phosphate regulon response regulator PhoB